MSVSTRYASFAAAAALGDIAARAGEVGDQRARCVGKRGIAVAAKRAALRQFFARRRRFELQTFPLRDRFQLLVPPAQRPQLDSRFGEERAQARQVLGLRQAGSKVGNGRGPTVKARPFGKASLELVECPSQLTPSKGKLEAFTSAP